MEATKQYICTENWARNKKGDKIDRWLYNKYPAEIQAKHFKLIEPAVVKAAIKPVAPVAPPRPISVNPVQ